MTGPIRVAHVSTIDATLRVLLFNQLKAIRDAGFDVAAVSAPGPWTQDLEREGIRHFSVPSLNRLRDLRADLQALGDLIRLFRRERFTIIHTHMPKTGVLGRFAARAAGIPIVVNTIHGMYGIEDRGIRRWFFLTLERLAAQASDFELCQGRELYDFLIRKRILSPARSSFLGNGIDLQYFNPAAVDADAIAALRRELDIPPDAPVVGTVGRMTTDKGYAEFFAAHERVQAVRPDVVFVACGPEDERDGLPPQTMSRARARGIRFLGHRSHMRDVYALMDIFVLATHREGFPRSAMEAAAMQTGLILTNIPGCRNVVTHDVDGLLTPVREPALLAEAILRFLHNDTLRRRFAEAARNRALAEFDERIVFQRVLSTYGKLLGSQDGFQIHGRLGTQGTARG